MKLHTLFSRRSHKLIGMLFLILGLSSCVPAALVLGATAGGAVVYDKRSMKTMVQDRDSAQAASNLINASSDLQQGTHISVATFNHIMLLVGQTTTEEQRTTAYQLASQVKYVSRVYNEITIQKPISMWQRSKDSWITTKVKTEMMATSGLHSTQVKVVTENGVVYLMGMLTPQQSELATNVARRIDGVREVVKVFQNQQ
ncbi:MAG: phospholipid-binding protein [Gammaproteobacteria bacterium CG_4_10_14_0_8_um_filter_38_16]|nr:MAG: phospholipid-binding protein [Gammaproteobacteria bacterium CG_4_10_14_0_8_um_filter_38_16]PJA03815.1 MAG: phospholipid-binding protein [Gammaproteobacteria bacterium CG_4_10_14_0_2_um_filter_38_22]PJB10789.1 MAG: phospholipid-binding protein [Gammaproteobacteria bacterium CG_4_9_14_3_um_filter_38_9]